MGREKREEGVKEKREGKKRKQMEEREGMADSNHCRIYCTCNTVAMRVSFLPQPSPSPQLPSSSLVSESQCGHHSGSDRRPSSFSSSWHEPWPPSDEPSSGPSRRYLYSCEGVWVCTKCECV